MPKIFPIYFIPFLFFASFFEYSGAKKEVGQSSNEPQQEKNEEGFGENIDEPTTAAAAAQPLDDQLLRRSCSTESSNFDIAQFSMAHQIQGDVIVDPKHSNAEEEQANIAHGGTAAEQTETYVNDNDVMLMEAEMHHPGTRRQINLNMSSSRRTQPSSSRFTAANKGKGKEIEETEEELRGTGAAGGIGIGPESRPATSGATWHGVRLAKIMAMARLGRINREQRRKLLKSLSFEKWPQSKPRNEEDSPKSPNTPSYESLEFGGFLLSATDNLASGEEEQLKDNELQWGPSITLVEHLLLTHGGTAEATSGQTGREQEADEEEEASQIWCQIIEFSLAELVTAAKVAPPPPLNSFAPHEVVQLIVNSRTSPDQILMLLHEISVEMDGSKCAPIESRSLLLILLKFREEWAKKKETALGKAKADILTAAEEKEEANKKTAEKTKKKEGEGFVHFCHSWWDSMCARTFCTFVAKALLGEVGKQIGSHLGKRIDHSVGPAIGALVASAPMARPIGAQFKRLTKGIGRLGIAGGRYYKPGGNFKVLGKVAGKSLLSDFGKTVIGAPLGNAMDKGGKRMKSFIFSASDSSSEKKDPQQLKIGNTGAAESPPSSPKASSSAANYGVIIRSADDESIKRGKKQIGRNYRGIGNSKREKGKEKALLKGEKEGNEKSKKTIAEMLRSLSLRKRKTLADPEPDYGGPARKRQKIRGKEKKTKSGDEANSSPQISNSSFSLSPSAEASGTRSNTKGRRRAAAAGGKQSSNQNLQYRLLKRLFFFVHFCDGIMSKLLEGSNSKSSAILDLALLRWLNELQQLLHSEMAKIDVPEVLKRHTIKAPQSPKAMTKSSNAENSPTETPEMSDISIGGSSDEDEDEDEDEEEDEDDDSDIGAEQEDSGDDDSD